MTNRVTRRNHPQRLPLRVSPRRAFPPVFVQEVQVAVCGLDYVDRLTTQFTGPPEVDVKYGADATGGSGGIAG